MADEQRMQAVIRRKRKERDLKIATLVGQNGGAQSVLGRAYWAMVYDFEQAPWTTNGKQLEELGVEVPHPDTLTGEELGDLLSDVFVGLGLLGVYLVHTDHLTDSELYARLREEVLAEPVRDTTCEEAATWVDLCGWSCGCEEQRKAFLKYYGDDHDRLEAEDEGVQVPERADLLCKRDESLPRPPAHIHPHPV